MTADYAASMTKLDGGIIRNAYGEGSSTEVLDVVIEGRKERIPVEIEVAEQRYTADEIQEMFDRVIRKLESEILNGNESLDRVGTGSGSGDSGTGRAGRHLMGT